MKPEISVPLNPLLVSAVQARMHQNMEAVSRLCVRYENTSKKVHSWDWTHLQILQKISTSQDQTLEESLQICKNLQELPHPFRLANSFLYLFELSGIFVRLRKYRIALDYSLAAERRSFDSNSFYSARLNSLVCQEALGFDLSNEIEKLGKALALLPAETLNPKIYSEFNALWLRFCFRKGHVTEIGKFRGPPHLYLEWLRRLPQFNLKAHKIQPHMGRHQTYSRFIFNTLHYRRTLEDSKAPPMNHWVDRLYLWTWTALTHPDKISIRHVLQMLEDLDFENRVELLTAEDQIMLSHCMILLSLFDPPSLKKVLRFTSKLGPGCYENHLMLSMEKRLLEDLVSLSQGRVVSSKAAPSSLLPFFRRLIPLTEEKITKYLPGLKVSFLGAQKIDYTKTVLDFPNGRLWDPRRQGWIVSESLALAFGFFLNREKDFAVNLVDFMETVFGIPYYDEFVHYRRIYNILTRMKSLKPGCFAFSIRKQVIHFKLNGRDFQCPSLDNQNEFDRVIWRKILSRIAKESSSPPVNRATWSDLLVQFQLHECLTRIHLQRTTGMSKAKTIRLLNHLIVQGKIKRLSSGKNSLYSLAAAQT